MRKNENLAERLDNGEDVPASDVVIQATAMVVTGIVRGVVGGFLALAAFLLFMVVITSL